MTEGGAAEALTEEEAVLTEAAEEVLTEAAEAGSTEAAEVVLTEVAEVGEGEEGVVLRIRGTLGQGEVMEGQEAADVEADPIVVGGLGAASGLGRGADHRGEGA